MSFLKPFRHQLRSKLQPSKGFTLLELLAVMAIIALLSLSLPALQSTLTAGTFNSNTSQLGDILKGAYSAAVARNTYVWVGLAQMPNGGVGVVATYSPSGSASDVFATNPSYLFKPVILQRLTLATAAIPASLVNRDTSGVAQIFSSSDNLTVADPSNNGLLDSPTIPATFGQSKQNISPNKSQTTTALIEITPAGQISISSGKYPWLEIGLQPANGNGKEAAVLQVNSFTGRVVQFQP